MKLKNKYYLLRHGEALSNVKKILSSWPEKGRFGLTAKGKKQAEEAGKYLKDKNIDYIFSSDLLRTKQTAEIVAKKLKIKPQFDKRLREYNFGEYNAGPAEIFTALIPRLKRFSITPKNGENYKDIAKRARAFIKETEKKYKGKNILVVSHQVPIIFFLANIEELSHREIFEKYIKNDRIKNGEIKKI